MRLSLFTNSSGVLALNGSFDECGFCSFVSGFHPKGGFGRLRGPNINNTTPAIRAMSTGLCNTIKALRFTHHDTYFSPSATQVVVFNRNYKRKIYIAYCENIDEKPRLSIGGVDALDTNWYYFELRLKRRRQLSVAMVFESPNPDN